MVSLRSESGGDPKHSNGNWNIWFYSIPENLLSNTFIADLSVDDQYELLTTGDFSAKIKDTAKRFKNIVERINDFASV